MSFAVQSQNLRRQAAVWSDRKDDVATVRAAISPGFGQGWKFGFMAGSAGVREMYDEWTSDMANCLTDAGYSFAYLDAALVSCANEYDDSDATAATSAQKLDKMIEESGYHHD
ncbi:hypothetical protein FHP29_10590 [Nocardioides albidus]|uniref:WXG100 family type VII secretion target n=1 Tax=Nocardioides albidus TaxID=1517589 RepID=A0A5C4VYZ4_9ACTN|nr:hypothetical protein [Nocardioides albidus]TNM40486.1 hypothetical protein FHP29_10590 [Nocardioides albidus]